MPLPKLGTTDWEDEKEFYLNATPEERAERARVLGMAPPSYPKRMRERGIYMPGSQAEPLEREKPTVNLPPVKLREYRAPKIKKGDEEIAVLHASDGHGGKVTKSFNKHVYRKRMWQMYQSTMVIVNHHREMYPIKRLLILNTGDNGQGENPHQGSKIGEVEAGARDQIKDIVAPAWNDVLGSFGQDFEEVEMVGVGGNHGYEKLAPETSRQDLYLYDVLEAGIGQQKNITINISNQWWAIKEVFGFKCFVFHGDGIPCQQGVPFFALDKKLKSWYMQFGGFNYAFGGHFHKRHSDEISSKLEYFMCGSLVSDDDWALKKLGISSNPSQSIYGIHPKYGVTWRYPLVVDYDFLPEGTVGI